MNFGYTHWQNYAATEQLQRKVACNNQPPDPLSAHTTAAQQNGFKGPIHFGRSHYTGFQPPWLPQLEASGRADQVHMLLLHLALLPSKPYLNIVWVSTYMIQDGSRPPLVLHFISRGSEA